MECKLQMREKERPSLFSLEKGGQSSRALKSKFFSAGITVQGL